MCLTAASSPTLFPTTTDFAGALARIPLEVPRVHHGRTIEGLDCVGLVICVYQLAGIDLGDCDMPYGVRDLARLDMASLVVSRLATRFREIPVRGRLQDGDVILLANGPRDNHLGLVIGNKLVQMKDRITRTPLERLWCIAQRAFRYRM